MADVDLARRELSLIPNGLSYSGTCHLQIAHGGQSALSENDMIGQEKLLTMKSRTELLFPQGGGVALNERMDDRRVGRRRGLEALRRSCSRTETGWGALC